MEVYLYSIICHDGTLLNEAVAILAFTSEISHFFDINTLRTGDENLRLYITTVQDG